MYDWIIMFYLKLVHMSGNSPDLRSIDLRKVQLLFSVTHWENKNFSSTKITYSSVSGPPIHCKAVFVCVKSGNLLKNMVKP